MLKYANRIPVAAWVVVLGMLIFQTSFGQLPASSSQAGAGAGTARQGRRISLRDQLRIGLKARTKSDLAFVETVVARVEQGKLPRRLVDSTFLWARARAVRRPGPRQLRPMIYFRPGLTLRAKRLGIVL